MFSYSSYPYEEHVLTPRSILRARVFVPLKFTRGHHPPFCQRFKTPHKIPQKKRAIMFKRLFGQPSGSTRGASGDGRPGSTSTGRAAFDAVDKLKDVRVFDGSFVLCRFLSENPPKNGNPKSL